MLRIEDTISGLQTKLNTSPTASQPNVAPKPSDVSNQVALETAQATKETQDRKKMQEAWYGKTLPTAVSAGIEPGNKMGFWGKALKTLGAPVAAGSGLLASALGKGIAPGVAENVRANVMAGGDYGDVLRSENIPNVIAAPLGFTLDVALDPVNWITAGESALIPRLFKGATAGGVEGAGAALKSGVLGKANTVAKYASALSPFGKGAINPEYPEFLHNAVPAKSLPVWMQNLAKSSTEADNTYNQIVHGGMDYLDRMSLNPEGRAMNWYDKQFARPSVAPKIEAVKTNPLAKQVFGYSPEAVGTEQKGQDIARAIEHRGMPGAEHFSEGTLQAMQARKYYSGKDARQAASLLDGTELGRTADPVQAQIDLMLQHKNEAHALNVEKQWNSILSDYLNNDQKVVARFNKVFGQDRSWKNPYPMTKDDFVSTFETFRSGVDGYDKVVAQILASHPGVAKALNAYAKFVSLFRVANTGWSLPTHVNAILGNAAMTSMAGVDIANPALWNSITQAKKFVWNGDDSLIRDVFQRSPQWEKLLKTYPEYFRSVTGVDPEFALQGISYLENVSQKAAQQIAGGMRKAGASEDEIAAAIERLGVYTEQGRTKLEEAAAIADKEARAVQKASLRAEASAEELLSKEKQIREANIAPSTVNPEETRRNSLVQEINMGVGAKWIRDLKKKADGGDMVARILHGYMTVPMDLYGKHDQVYKLGLAAHLSMNGVTEGELRSLQRWFRFKPDQIIKSKLGGVYKLTPEAALDVSNEIYLNYQAMPAFVKIVKNFPILGGPFTSFTYGMASNVLKTTAYNPSFFNKVNFMAKEFAGRMNPLEKKQLDTKYYDYLKGPEFMKIPFFKQNPVYINMAQYLPHYSLNLLQTTDRTVGDQWGDKIANLVDRSFLFKDPAGQVLLNYVIMPMLLGKAVDNFGQPLYPPKSTGVQKAEYAASDIVNTLLPRTPTSAVGLIPNLPIPGGDATLQKLPYKIRAPQYGVSMGANARGVQPASADAQNFNKIKAVLRELGVQATRVSTNPAKK